MTPRAANMVVEGVLEGCTLPQMCRALCDRRKVSAHRNTQPAGSWSPVKMRYR